MKNLTMVASLLTSALLASTLLAQDAQAQNQYQSPLVGTWYDQEEGMVIQINPCRDKPATFCALVISEHIADGELSLLGQTIVRDIVPDTRTKSGAKIWRGRLTAEGMPKAKVEMKLKSSQNLEATYCAGMFCDTSRYVRQ